MGGISQDMKDKEKKGIGVTRRYWTAVATNEPTFLRQTQLQRSNRSKVFSHEATNVKPDDLPCWRGRESLKKKEKEKKGN